MAGNLWGNLWEGALQPHRHGDARARVTVQAAADHVRKRGVAQWRHVDHVRRVGDGVHLLDKRQRRERRVARHHLVQDAAQAPDVRWAAHLARTKQCRWYCALPCA